MPYRFYDIESLQDVFTLASYNPNNNSVNVYVLYGDAQPLPTDSTGEIDSTFHKYIEDFVHKCNSENFSDGKVNIFDLSTEYGNIALIDEFGLGEITEEDSTLYILGDNSKIGDGTIRKIPLQATIIAHDTSLEYNQDKDYYVLGYNSYNYDTTMLALYYSEVFCELTQTDCANLAQNYGIKAYPSDGLHLAFKPTTAKTMRAWNDELFTDEYIRQMPSRLNFDRNGRKLDWHAINPAKTARREMISTGRYIDVARLNEKQQKVALKRLLGMIGCQILESNKLGPGMDKIETDEELAELIAYNVSDVVNLDALFHNNLYHSQFELKREMLNTYPELRYKKDRQDRADKGIPTYTISPDNVRAWRLYPDSSSQQFASKCLCPDGNLLDKATVSFMYPHEKKCEEGQTPYNVIEESKQFFYNEILPLIKDDEERAQAQAEFDNVYNYYKDIEGVNFDESEAYKSFFLEPEPGRSIPEGKGGKIPKSIRDIPKRPNCLRYIGPDGKPTSCFVTFSIGGIHGAEFNEALYNADIEEWKEYMKLLETVQKAFGETEGIIETDANGNEIVPGAVALRRSVTPAKAPIDLEFPDGKEHFINEFLKSGFTKNKAYWKDSAKPELFKTNDDGSTKLNKKYVFTSVVDANHEDFTSYYPNMLRMMNVFENDNLGYDRYGEIFDNKQRYNVERKDPTKTEKEREVADLKREGVKLILNTASGAGDATFDNPIRMNNNIIAMRIIGQNFSWRIGQAQAAKGARVVSTNTDGLYTDLEEELNNKILEHESSRIGVEIEPERLKLISKDSNNRIEYKVKTKEDGSTEIEIISASGGDLACRKGPDPAKSLAHPAIVDNVLCDYLITISEKYGQDGMSMPFDPELCMEILKKATKEGTLEHRMLLFQNVLASNPSSYSYLFGKDDDDNIINLQHYNRVFFMKDDFDVSSNPFMRPGDALMYLWKAQAAKITPAQKKVRANNPDIPDIQNDYEASSVLKTHGVNIDKLNRVEQRETRVAKVTDVNPEWKALVMNHAIMGAEPDFLQEILDNLNLDVYLEMVKTTYENNWRNKIPGDTFAEEEIEGDEEE